jgi:hypothetical protein
MSEYRFDPALADAIHAFRATPAAWACRTARGAREAGCFVPTWTFHHSLAERGMAPRFVWFSPAAAESPREVCVWVAGWFVDWAARGHTPSLPVPWVFTDPAPTLPVYGRVQLWCDPCDAPALQAAGLQPGLWPARRHPLRLLLAMEHAGIDPMVALETWSDDDRMLPGEAAALVRRWWQDHPAACREEVTHPRLP